MFAVLKTGGKQYRVQSGDVLRVEKLAATAGETVQFNEVLMVGATVGAPLVDDAGVQAEVLDQIKGPKTINFVKRRRKHSSKRTKGHRQQLTLLRVTDILESGAGASGVKAAVGAAGVAPAAVEAAAPAAAPVAQPVPEAEASVEMTKPGNLLEAARDGGADDLTQIKGLGKLMVDKLAAQGVFHLDQIAAWTDAEVAFMQDALGMKAARIVKEEWVSQAAALVAGDTPAEE